MTALKCSTRSDNGKGMFFFFFPSPWAAGERCGGWKGRREEGEGRMRCESQLLARFTAQSCESARNEGDWQGIESGSTSDGSEWTAQSGANCGKSGFGREILAHQRAPNGRSSDVELVELVER